MKITKEYLRTIIKEELDKLDEGVLSPALQKARREITANNYDNLTTSELDTVSDKEDEIRNLLSKDKSITPQQIADLESIKGFNSKNPLAKKMANSSKIRQPAPAGSDEKKFRDTLIAVSNK